MACCRYYEEGAKTSGYRDGLKFALPQVSICVVGWRPIEHAAIRVYGYLGLRLCG